MTIIDAAAVFAARSKAAKPDQIGYQCLLLGPDVTVGELLHALRGSGIVLTTGESGVNIIHRQPTDAA